MLKIKPDLYLLARFAIGALFAYTGYQKLLEPSANFAGAILSYQIVDLRTANAMAAVLPWVELILGVFFILGLWARISCFILGALNFIFIAAISSALIRKIPVQDCGCFGENSHFFPIQATLVMDLAVMVFLWILWIKKEKLEAFSLDGRLRRSKVESGR